mmetsp:Transcript_2370/g.5019  ORF Transcript_2370/g.5019 Transcript_2370/m.5019 type:complete len:242 (-) Transcript_2370:710-1435(-)
MDPIRFGSVRFDLTLIRLDWIALHWIRLDWIGLDSICFVYSSARRPFATVHRIPRNRAAEGAPMSRGTHNRFDTVSRAMAPCWVAPSVAPSTTLAMFSRARKLSERDKDDPDKGSVEAIRSKTEVTCLRRASVVSPASGLARGMCCCERGSSRRQSARTASWLETSFAAASRATSPLLSSATTPPRALAKPPERSSAAASARAIPSATFGLSSPPPKYRRNMEAVAVHEYASPATRAPYGA